MNTKTMNAQEVEQYYHKAVVEARYADALAVVTDHFAVFPNDMQRVPYIWRIDMACRLNDRQQAINSLREAVNLGHWYHKLDEYPPCVILKDLPEFAQLVNRCEQLRAAEMATAPSVIKILEPAHKAAQYPLVFALHGNSENVDIFATHWQEAVKDGWLVALPQSPQANGADAYVWNDWDWTIPSLQAHFAAVHRDFAIDKSRVILAGFSAGAGMALTQALEREFAVQGVIAVAPFLGSADELRPLLAKPANKALRVYMVASKADEYCYNVAQDLANLFPEYGIAHKLDIYTDEGHAFPASFEDNLPRALDWILHR